MDIGPYRLVRELGSGGMGSVHEAVHTITHRRVALKLLHAHVYPVPARRATLHGAGTRRNLT